VAIVTLQIVKVEIAIRQHVKLIATELQPL